MTNQSELVARAQELFPQVPWRRFVALGDSITEGIGDSVEGYPDGGWVPMVGEALRTVRPDFEYVNLGQRYLTTAEIRSTQLERAIELQPDLVTVVAGGNDMLKEHFDPQITEDEFDAMVVALLDTGATVMTFTMFNIFTAGVMTQQVIDMLAPRFDKLNDTVLRVAKRRGLPVVELTPLPASSDPGIYSKDLQHANMRGHAIAADAILNGMADLASRLARSA